MHAGLCWASSASVGLQFVFISPFLTSIFFIIYSLLWFASTNNINLFSILFFLPSLFPSFLSSSGLPSSTLFSSSPLSSFALFSSSWFVARVIFVSLSALLFHPFASFIPSPICSIAIFASLLSASRQFVLPLPYIFLTTQNDIHSFLFLVFCCERYVVGFPFAISFHLRRLIFLYSCFIFGCQYTNNMHSFFYLLVLLCYFHPFPRFLHHLFASLASLFWLWSSSVLLPIRSSTRYSHFSCSPSVPTVSTHPPALYSHFFFLPPCSHTYTHLSPSGHFSSLSEHSHHAHTLPVSAIPLTSLNLPPRQSRPDHLSCFPFTPTHSRPFHPCPRAAQPTPAPPDLGGYQNLERYGTQSYWNTRGPNFCGRAAGRRGNTRVTG